MKMAFQEAQDLGCETTIRLGGTDKKTGKNNPKTAEGFYVGSRRVTTKFGPSWVHVLQTSKGNVGIWGKTDLDSKLLAITKGTMVRLTYTHSVPSNKGNDLMKYKVEFDKDNTIEVADGAPASSESEGGDYESAFSGGDDGETDEALEEESAPDEQPVHRPQPPKAAAKVPNAAQQARVQALLNGGKRAG
jgi:hypothetical protein